MKAPTMFMSWVGRKPYQAGEIPGVLDQGQGCSGARASTVTVEWTKRANRKVYNIVHLKYVSCGDIAVVIQQSCCFAVSRAQRLIC